jgi:hypothetical protein
MAESRGKKGKKGKWQVNLGIKEAIGGGLGVAVLLMLSFALGTLAGRGDIYRVLSNWGLVAPESVKTTTGAPPALSPTPTPTAAPAGPQPQEAAAVPAAAPVSPANGPQAAPSTPTPAAKKKNDPREAKKKNNAVQKIKQDVAKNLKFQNSLDPADLKAGSPDKQKSKDKTAAAKTTPSLVYVAKYRDSKMASARVAAMRKLGEKVSLKEGKDGEGPYFAIYRQLPAAPAKTTTVAKKPSPGTQTPKKTAKTDTKTKPSQP